MRNNFTINNCMLIGAFVFILCMCMNVKVSYGADSFTVYQDKTSSYKGNRTSLKKIGSVKGNGKYNKGKYPTRKGVILVTASGKIANVVGHSAIVYSSGYVIESVQNGVIIGRNNWKTRKCNMAAVTVRKTTRAQDAKVSDWCRRQKGKKYNFDYYNMNKVKEYYCSQLIWAGFKNLYKIDLNTKAYDVGNKKAIGPYEFVRKSASVIFPIYIQKWNRNDVTSLFK